MKKLAAIILASVLAATLSACGNKGETASGDSNSYVEKSSKVKDEAYTVNYAGVDITGTYTGEWENDTPNGFGEFKSNEEGFTFDYAGNWMNGVFHGQGELIIDGSNNLSYVSGDFFNGKENGQVYEEVYYYDTSSGLDHWQYKGEVMNYASNGYGQYMEYYTDGSYTLFEGEFLNDDFCDGKIEYTDFDKNGTVTDTGKFQNGELVSDTEIKIKNGIYDVIQYFAYEKGVGELYDSFAPYVYDRNAN